MADPFVYVIGSSDGGPLKIGYANHPKSRLTDIQIGHLRKLSILFQLQHARAPDVEGKAQAALRRYRLTGEWFDVGKDLAVAAVLLAAEEIEDTPPPLPEALDVQPWQIKNFPVDMRKQIVGAAKKRNMGVGEWMFHYFTHWHPIHETPTRALPENLAALEAELERMLAELSAPPRAPEALE